MVKNEHNENGTIYICYQGVGKSSTVNKYDGFIDLESSNFRLENGFRPENWYKFYTQIAFDLASQGYSVFVSSHDVVRKQISYMKDKYYPNVDIYMVYPSVELKNEWIERLEKRYDENPTEKNRVTYLNAKDRFTENIAEMKKDADDFGFNEVEIDTCKYKLIDKLPLNDDNVARCYETGE
jgi:hypothetical protein